MASNSTSPLLKPTRGKGKTNVPATRSVSASVSVTPRPPASTPAAEPEETTNAKLDFIMRRLDKLNVLDEVTNLTKSLEFCHESIAELKRENVELRTRVTELDRNNSEQQRAAKVDHDALVDLTWRSMRDNLLFYAIPEAGTARQLSRLSSRTSSASPKILGSKESTGWGDESTESADPSSPSFQVTRKERWSGSLVRN